MSKSNEAETSHHLAKNLKRFDYNFAKVVKTYPSFLFLLFHTQRGYTNLINRENVQSVLTHALTAHRSRSFCCVFLSTTRHLCISHLLRGLDGVCISFLADLCKHMRLYHIAISVVQEGLGFHDLILFEVQEKILWGISKFPFSLD